MKRATVVLGLCLLTAGIVSATPQLGRAADPASALRPAPPAPSASQVRNGSPVVSVDIAHAPLPKAAAQVSAAPYRDAHRPVDRRVADLLSRMTLPEKIAQLQSVNWEHTHLYDEKTFVFSKARAQKLMPLGIGQITRPGDKHDAHQSTAFANAIQHFLVESTRLGIPAILHEEALHGFVGPAATSFPQALALASTFDTRLVEDIFTTAAKQMRSRGVTEALAPVVDVARDPRWGRIEETFGEDPHLVTRLGVAAIQGFQGRRDSEDAAIDSQHVMATAKHFTAHGTPEGGRNTAPGNVSPRVVREVFLPPFEAAVREARVGSVMASYNELDGVPSHANRALLEGILRTEWGFKGLVVSDYFGIAELERKHHVVSDLREAGRRSLLAGVDIELPEPEGYAYIAADIASGKLSLALVDASVARILRTKFLLGLFEKPFVEVERLAAESPADRALALRAAEEAIILLKNDKNALPLDAKRLKTLAVIGPNGSTCRLGGYSGTPIQKVSIVEGLKAKLGSQVNVVTAEGCGLTEGGRGWSDDVVTPSDPVADARLLADAAKLAATADTVVLVLGLNEQLSREGWADNHRGDRMSLDLPGRQMDLARAVLATGKPTVLVLIGGAPVVIPELAKSVPAILQGFFLGQETGTAVANVLFGDVNPSGRLPVSIPRNTGSVPMYYNHKPSARRAYLFEDVGPEWAFGHGLSYTTFAYSDVKVSPVRIAPTGRVTVSATVTNKGKREGDEIAQLYVHDVVASVTRPVRELKGFRRIHLKPGEKARVAFSLGPDELSFYDIDMHRGVESGAFEIAVGGNSTAAFQTKFEVVAP